MPFMPSISSCSITGLEDILLARIPIDRKSGIGRTILIISESSSSLFRYLSKRNLQVPMLGVEEASPSRFCSNLIAFSCEPRILILRYSGKSLCSIFSIRLFHIPGTAEKSPLSMELFAIETRPRGL